MRKERKKNREENFVVVCCLLEGPCILTGGIVCVYHISIYQRDQRDNFKKKFYLKIQDLKKGPSKIISKKISLCACVHMLCRSLLLLYLLELDKRAGQESEIYHTFEGKNKTFCSFYFIYLLYFGTVPICTGVYTTSAYYSLL